MGMTKTLVAAALLAAAPGLASAALLDFTKNGTLSGTFMGVGYTVTGAPLAPNQIEAFDGDASKVLAPLALENDGIGIRNDEISFMELLTVTFDRKVTVDTVYFLDLFKSPRGTSEEVALVTADTMMGTLTFGALEKFPGTGYAEGSTGGLTGRIFNFTSDITNDDIGEPDFALAGLDIAPIPLPAGALLLGTGLVALGAARRRKK